MDEEDEILLDDDDEEILPMMFLMMFENELEEGILHDTLQLKRLGTHVGIIWEQDI